MLIRFAPFDNTTFSINWNGVRDTFVDAEHLIIVPSFADSPERDFNCHDSDSFLCEHS